MIKKELPSGATLEITLAPFSDANDLRRIVASELKNVKISSELELTEPNFIKELFCTGMASKEIEASIWNLLKRCTYNGLKIIEDTFEPIEARGDYLSICSHVAIENLRPFANGLLSQFKDIFKNLAQLR